MDELLEPEQVRIAILGSTGSIGRQALDVVRAHPGRFKVTGLAAGSDEGLLTAQAAEFGVGLIGLANSFGSRPDGIVAVDGPDSAAKVAEAADAHVVLNAVVGAAGLHASLATLVSGKTLALANKESLVAAGELIMAKAGPGQIRPVDSEHSALWQILEGVPAHLVRRVVLTGSGGPFRGRALAELEHVTVEEALAHPVWDMGPKITIDSATLMNKGLEVIEAHYLFGFTYDEIDVLIHPQGLIHAMADSIDGSTFVYAARPDMRLPIRVALGWPERLASHELEPIEWSQVTFEPVDTEAFPCLGLAYEAGRRGDTYPAALNAANEIAVRAFLDGRLRFTGISEIVGRVLEDHTSSEASLDGVTEADEWARARALEFLP